MKNDNWLLGDEEGNRYVEVPSPFPKDVVEKLDYVIYGGVLFVSAKRLHEERIRRLEDE